jgi:hypothetical protein
MTPTRVTNRHRDRDCHDAACPTVWDTDDPATVAVQGTLPAAALAGLGEVPGHEGVVLVPRSLLESWRPSNDAR